MGLWQRLFPQHGRIAAIGYGRGAMAHKMKRAGVGAGHDGENGLRLFYGDQSDAAFLKEVENDLGLGVGGEGQKFSVIVDDGSHVPWHQIFTFEHIFERWLAEGGIYIIEDIETSYWDNPTPIPLFGYKFHAGVGTNGSAVEKMKQVVDVMNRKFLEDANYTAVRGDQLVASITFSRNCIALVKKKRSSWKLVDTVHDVIPYRPGNALEKSRSAYLQYKQKSAWVIEGSPKNS